MTATIGLAPEPPETIAPLGWWKNAHSSAKAAAAGASQPRLNAGDTWPDTGCRIMAAATASGLPNRRRLIFSEGRRGAQERNCLSNSFISFIRCSFQARFQLL